MADTTGGASETSAKTIVSSFLATYGLQGLGEWAWGELLGGATLEQVTLSMRDRPEYAQRFPYMKALQQKGRAITEAQAIAYETSATNLMRSYGLPAGFYDQPDDFAKLLGGEVGLPELENRLQTYQSTAQQMAAIPEVATELAKYGLNASDLMANFIDPDRALPALQQKAQAALIGATATNVGFGELDINTGAELAARGITQEQAQTGFGKLAGLREVGLTLPGEVAGTGTSKDDMIGAVFRGDAEAAKKLARTQESRGAAFSGNTAFTTSAAGFSGIGSASR